MSFTNKRMQNRSIFLLHRSLIDYFYGSSVLWLVNSIFWQQLPESGSANVRHHKNPTAYLPRLIMPAIEARLENISNLNRKKRKEANKNDDHCIRVGSCWCCGCTHKSIGIFWFRYPRIMKLIACNGLLCATSAVFVFRPGQKAGDHKKKRKQKQISYNWKSSNRAYPIKLNVNRPNQICWKSSTRGYPVKIIFHILILITMDLWSSFAIAL